MPAATRHQNVNKVVGEDFFLRFASEVEGMSLQGVKQKGESKREQLRPFILPSRLS